MEGIEDAPRVLGKDIAFDISRGGILPLGCSGKTATEDCGYHFRFPSADIDDGVIGIFEEIGFHAREAGIWRKVDAPSVGKPVEQPVGDLESRELEGLDHSCVTPASDEGSTLDVYEERIFGTRGNGIRVGFFVFVAGNGDE